MFFKETNVFFIRLFCVPATICNMVARWRPLSGSITGSHICILTYDYLYIYLLFEYFMIQDDYSFIYVLIDWQDNG